MSVFVLKLLAVISMFIDHLTYVLRLSGHLAYGPQYITGRAIGRPAFLIYCFLLVNGFGKTRDRKKYLSRLIMFAAVSQIPFSFAFSVGTYQNLGWTQFSFGWHTALILLFPLAVYFLCVCELRFDFSLIWLAAVFFASTVKLTYRGLFLFDTDTNVFYTLALGMAMMMAAEYARSDRRKWWKLLLIAAALLVEMYFVQPHSDYGILGACIIFALYLTKNSRVVQCLVIILGCLAEYYWSVPYFIAAVCAVVPIMIYNGRLGPKMRRFFYIFYPAHLALLGVFFFILSRR